MVIVLAGAPGAGKGTHGRRIAAKRGLRHVSSGDLLREAVEKGTELGKKASEYMKAGSLVPDEIMLQWVEELLEDPTARSGIVLDGFPRTVPQAEGLDGLLARHEQSVDCVLFFDIAEDDAVRRLSSRVSCVACGFVYNLHANPPASEGVCDRCGERLEVRADDREETVRARFEEFRRLTAPMVDYYREQGKVATITTSGSIDEVGKRITEVLDSRCGMSRGSAV